MTGTEAIVIPPAVVDLLRDVVRQLAGKRLSRIEPERTGPVEFRMGEPRLLNAVEAGKLLGVNESTVRKLWCSGDLKCVHIGRGRKVSTTEIQRYINDHERFEVSPS